MATLRARILALLGATSTCVALVGCGFPDYTGFDKPRGQSDAAAPDAAEEGEPDAHDGAADAADADVAQDVVSEDVGADGHDAEAGEDADAAEAETAWCTSNDDCEHDPAGPFCDLATGRCGACLPDQDVCPSGQYCSASTLRCELGCKGDPDCVVAGPDGGKDDGGAADDADTDGGTDDGGEPDAGPDAKVLTCDPVSHACTGCDVDDDCPLGTICQTPACVAGCTVDHPCPTGRDCCGGVCLDTSNDLQHCGNCSTACTDPPNAQAACESGGCVIANCLEPHANCDGDYATGCETDISTSLQHCGGCGAPCVLPNATAECSSGVCAIAQCNLGFADCDLDPWDGCEVQTASDEAACGSCDHSCGLLPHAVPACIGSSCEVGACDDGYADCNSTATDGCETPTQANVNNCGGCGVVCSMLHANAGCAGGTCGIASCVSPWADCDDLTGNGCEVDVTLDPLHCGTCTNACSYPHAAGVCSGGSCGLGACAAGFADCDTDAPNGCEVSTQTSVSNCGGCGNACDSTNGVPSCAAGQCSIACQSGFANCNENAVDGCEVATTNSVANCGACGKICSVAHGTPACNGTTCQVAACSTGWGDCNGQYADGCEATLTTTADCGLCGNPCAPANAVGSCATGSCAIVSCSSGYQDCDGDPTNGCEVNLNNDVNHCGSCPNKCPSAGCTPKCTAGVCGCSTCTVPGTADCDNDPGNGCETTTTTDPGNCGGCGAVCSAPNGTPGCAGSTCTVASCNPGWDNCNGVASDGCETNLHTLSNCASCGTSCDLANAAESCSTGTCLVTACDPGWGNCDGNAANGCELNTASAPLNCGSCGNVCSSTDGTATCTSGACGIVCNAGFANCDGNAANGCETNTTTSATNCGGCGAVCDSTHGTPSCSSGTCAIACSAGWGNCDSNASNGCETDTGSNLSNCGACGSVCSSVNGTASCVSGTCDIACNGGFGDCDGVVSNGCEASLQSDPLHCGACPVACNLAHAVNACVGGTCSIGSCNTGWADCDLTPSTGCETNTGSGINNCGACGNICNSTNGTATCTSGGCGITCNAGWGNCDGSAANGCELSTATSVNNCGSCGHVCAAIAHGTAACIASVCGIGSCDTNYHEIGGACVPIGEICDNGVDDEGDGRIDCFDTDCLTSPACAGRCMDAAAVACDVSVLTQSTSASGSTQRIATPSYSCTPTSFAGPEYAYKFTGGAGQDVFVEAYGLSGDVAVMAVDVATGAQCAANTSCSKAGDLSTNANPEAIGFTTVAGHDYYIVVDGAAAQTYSLSVQCSTPGGCYAAKAIQAGQTLSASNATGQGNTTNNAINSYTCGTWTETGPEAAFIFTPTATGNYQVDVTSLDSDCDLFVLNTNNCSSTCLSSSACSENAGTSAESVTFSATANKSYFIVVDGYSGNVCSFNIAVTKL